MQLHAHRVPATAAVATTCLQDEGDATKEASPRDIVYALEADAADAAAVTGNGSSSSAGATPRKLAETDLRCGGIAWCDDDLAILLEVRLGLLELSVSASYRLSLLRCVLASEGGVGVSPQLDVQAL